MKTIVFFIMLLLVGSKVTNKAESFSYNKEIILSVSDNIDRDIKGQTTQPSPEERPISRGGVYQYVYAYLSDNVVKVYFSMPVENIAIDIFNSDTYENVYSEFSSNATTFYINLSSEEKGNYAAP